MPLSVITVVSPDFYIYLLKVLFLAAPYDLLVTDGRMHDVDEDDWDRWPVMSKYRACVYLPVHSLRCEYIFYRGLYRTVYARVSRGVVTDTELQLAQFVLPKHGYGVTNETLEARMLRSYKEDLPEVHVRHR